MTRINATFEVQNSELLGRDICSICPFKTINFNDKPCVCKVFNKELEGWYPTIDIPSYKEYLRLQECIDSEVKNVGLTYSPLTEDKKNMLKELMGSASSKQIDFNKVRDEWRDSNE